MAKKPVQLDEKGYRKFGIRDKLAYAAGDLGCNMSFGLKGTVQTFWLVFMFMETGLFSILLLLVQAWDAINDPLIGSLIDSDRRRATSSSVLWAFCLVVLPCSCLSPVLPPLLRLFCSF